MRLPCTDPIRGCRPRLQPLLEAEQFRAGETGRSSGVGPLVKGLGTAPVVLGDPGANGPSAPAEAVGDLLGGVSLVGQTDRLEAAPDPLLGESLGQALQFVEGQMVLDVHGEAPERVSKGASVCPTRKSAKKGRHGIPGKRII